MGAISGVSVHQSLRNSSSSEFIYSTIPVFSQDLSGPGNGRGYSRTVAQKTVYRLAVIFIDKKGDNGNCRKI
jgi:hypothetical protein